MNLPQSFCFYRNNWLTRPTAHGTSEGSNISQWYGRLDRIGLLVCTVRFVMISFFEEKPVAFTTHAGADVPKREF